MTRLIDADAFKLYVQRCILIDEDLSTEQIERYLLAAIDGFTEIDAVPVVRCKDCKHYRPQKKSAHWENRAYYCNRIVTIKVQPYDFCSYGERKDGDGNG